MVMVMTTTKTHGNDDANGNDKWFQYLSYILRLQIVIIVISRSTLILV